MTNEQKQHNAAFRAGLSGGGWAIAPTSVHRTLGQLFTDAQSDSGVHAVVGAAGCGKSETVKAYTAANRRAYSLTCAEYWNRKTFMTELLAAVGCDPSGCTIGEMMHEAVRALKSRENPLLILDEADKLNDQVLYFFITLYNQLEDSCGIILLATDFLRKRVTRGVALKKKGYDEIYSRIGRRFIELPGNTYDDLSAICAANGLSDHRQIETIIGNSEADVRRVKKLVRAQIKKSAKTA